MIQPIIIISIIISQILNCSIRRTAITDSGIGSQYGQKGDIWAQQALACAPTTHIDNTMHVCAHRYLPCGTVLEIVTERNHLRSWCTVMDRGPYGAIIPNEDGTSSWGIKIKPTDPGVWRGILDMSPAVTRDMQHVGYERIRYWVIKKSIFNGF